MSKPKKMKSTLLAFGIILTLCSARAQDWENVGTSGITSGQDGRALIEWNGQLVMAGKFSSLDGIPIGNIAIWDGSSWSQLGDGISGDVRCTAIYNGELYIGGNINTNATSLNDLPSVCKLANGVWTGVSDENVVGIADDMLVWNGELYVVSNFWSLPNKIMKFDGTNWTQVGGDVGQFGDNHSIATIDTFNNELYIAGRFADLETSGANHIAKFNGNTWESVGFPTSGEENNLIKGWINDIVSHEGKLYVGGSIHDFTGSSTTDKPRLASYDGTSWTGYSFDENNSGEIKSLLIHEGVLYCGGEFAHWEQNEVANGVLIFNEMDDNEFMTTGFYNADGSSNAVEDLAVINGSVYATGDFENFGTSGVTVGIARFNGVLPLPFTSVNEFDYHSLNVHPNPAVANFNVEGVQTGNLRIFNATGEIVAEKVIESSSRNIDISSLSSALYLVVLQTEDALFSQRLVVQ